jgi:hypothetical protein
MRAISQVWKIELRSTVLDTNNTPWDILMNIFLGLDELEDSATLAPPSEATIRDALRRKTIIIRLTREQLSKMIAAKSSMCTDLRKLVESHEYTLVEVTDANEVLGTFDVTCLSKLDARLQMKPSEV